MSRMGSLHACSMHVFHAWIWDVSMHVACMLHACDMKSYIMPAICIQYF